MILFIHGAGRRGEAAWPGIDRDDAVFADLGEGSSVDSQAEVIAGLVEAPLTVVAHSLGAVPTILALPRIREHVERLILVEPALYDIARGDESIEAHIAAMNAAHERVAADDLYGFWEIVRPIMFGGPADSNLWPEERARAEWFAAVPRPWGHALHANVLERVPTLVVTGNWNPEYEAIASALVAVGAEHAVLEGHQHRPQDHPDFASLLA